MRQMFGLIAPVAVGVVALWSPVSVLAQDEIAVPPAELPPTVPTDAVEISISNLLGTPVVDATGADLGQIADVIIDADTGLIARLIISTGGIAGFFDKKVAVDPASVRLVPVDGRIVASGLTPDEIEVYSRLAEGN